MNQCRWLNSFWTSTKRILSKNQFDICYDSKVTPTCSTSPSPQAFFPLFSLPNECIAAKWTIFNHFLMKEWKKLCSGKVSPVAHSSTGNTRKKQHKTSEIFWNTKKKLFKRPTKCFSLVRSFDRQGEQSQRELYGKIVSGQCDLYAAASV